MPNTATPGWLNIALHELGHAQGLFLHSPSPTHKMYQYGMTAPTLNLTPFEHATLDYLYTLRDNSQRMNIAETSVPADLSKALHVNTTGVVSSK